MCASILHFSDDNIISIDTYVVGKIVDQGGNRPFLLYSINGQKCARTSFILDKFLLYLTTKKAANPTWTNNSHSKFINTRSGEKEGDTFSIHMWSKPFIAEINEREVAVLLMESNGSLNEQTHQNQSEILFAISSLFSSVMIFYIKKDIKRNTIQLLQLYTGFTKIIIERKDTTQSEKILFQKLIVLIRDLEFNQYHIGCDDNLCNSAAALAIKKSSLHFKDDHPVEFCLVREDINGNFMDIGLICLPHAEKALTKDDNRKHVYQQFQCHLKTFVQLMFPSENIKSRQMSTKETRDNFKQEVHECWTKLFHGNEISEFKSVYETVAEMQNTIIIQKALNFYDKKINNFVQANPNGVNENSFQQNSAYLSNESVDAFYKSRRMGGSETGKRFADNLRRLILTRENKYFQLNQNGSKDEKVDMLQLEVERNRIETEAAEAEKRHQEESYVPEEASEAEIRHQKETEASEAKKVHHAGVERILQEETSETTPLLLRQNEETNRQTQLESEELIRVQADEAEQSSRLEKLNKTSQRKRFFFFNFD